MRQISRSRAGREQRHAYINSIATHLERTTWGRGVYMPRKVVPAARPAQIKAGARKLYDVMSAQIRREKGGAL